MSKIFYRSFYGMIFWMFFLDTKLKTDKIAKDKIIKYTALLLFGILTFCLMLKRVPFWDEAHAWLIAKNLNFFELFQIEKYDGHLFIWHSLLMPFAHNNLMYPYPMYFLNWLFCMAALIILWNRAPFSNLTKFLITFSCPFFWYYAMVARCYSLSVFSLFLILAFYKQRLQKPVLFASLLVFAANTSVMAILGAFSIGLIFIKDLLVKKDKSFKNFYPFLIMGFGAILVLTQLLGAHFPEKITPLIFLYWLTVYFFFASRSEVLFLKIINISMALLTLGLYVLFLVNYAKNKRALSFFIVVNLLLFLFFFFGYSGLWWHFLFFYIYFIFALWIAKEEKIESGNHYIKTLFSYFLILFLVLFLSKTLLFKLDKWSVAYDSPALTVVQELKRHNITSENSKIYTPDDLLYHTLVFVPYFKNMKIYDTNGIEKYSLQGLKDDRINYKIPVNTAKLIESLDKNKTNYMVTSNEHIFFSKSKYNFRLKILSQSTKPYYAIFQIINEN